MATAQPSSCASLAPWSCRAVPSTTSATDAELEGPARDGGEQVARRGAVLAHRVDQHLERLQVDGEVGGRVQGALDALEEGGERLDLLGGGPVEHHRGEVEQDAVEHRRPSRARSSWSRCSSTDVAPFSRSCRIASLAGLVVDDLHLGPHVPGTGARADGRWW